MKLLGFHRFTRKHAALVAALVAVTGSAALAGEPLADAQAYAKQAQWGPALERIEQHLAARPRDAQGRLLKGVILTELNRQNEALAVFQKLAEDFPDLPEPHNNMAVIFAQQKQYDKARNALIAALKTNPSYATAYDNLGDIYARLASQAYDKALQTDSANTAPPLKLAMVRAVATTPRAEMAVVRAPAPVAPTPAPAPVAAANVAPPQLAPPPAPMAPPAKPSQPPAPPAGKAAAKPEPKSEAKPEAKPEKTEKPAQDAQATARLEVGRAVQAWAAAWSRKDVKTYLGAYARDFQPPGRLSRSAWEAERSQRVGKPGKIEVRVENLRVSLEGDTATAYFKQYYNSANLDSSGSKVLVMVKRDGRWLIQQERVGHQ